MRVLMAFLIVVINSSLMSVCPSPLKSSRHTVLTASLAGALTRHSATGSMTAMHSSGGVCWPARQGRFRTIQVRVPPWLHAWHIFGYQGSFLKPITLWMTRNTSSIQWFFFFLELSRILSLMERGLGQEEEFWLSLAMGWPS